jgi:hypothetical protein
MTMPISLSLNLPEMGAAEAGSQLRGVVFLGNTGTREDESTCVDTLGVEDSDDVPRSGTPLVSGKFKLYTTDHSFALSLLPYHCHPVTI